MDEYDRQYMEHLKADGTAADQAEANRITIEERKNNGGAMLFDFNKKPYRSSVIVGRTNATIAKFNTSAQGYEEPDFVELDKHFDLIYDCLLYTSEKLAYVWGASGVTPMERQAVGFIDINKNYATKLRGYGFGNILTEAHITQLGGIEAIKKEAPCYMVQELNIGDKQALYLQLQDDIHKPDLENKMKLKQYLTPLLYPIDLLRLSANQRYIEWGVIPERDIYSGGLCLLEEEMDELMRLDALGREKITEMYDRRSKENIKSAQERKEQELLEKQRLAYKDIVLEITEDAYPEALPITIEFERITVKKKKAFERIITAWALTALNNGFSNEGAHDISGLMWENNRCCFQCDLGSGFEEILDALQRMLNWFCKTENLKVRLFTTQSFDKLE